MRRCFARALGSLPWSATATTCLNVPSRRTWSLKPTAPWSMTWCARGCALRHPAARAYQRRATQPAERVRLVPSASALAAMATDAQLLLLEPAFSAVEHALWCVPSRHFRRPPCASTHASMMPPVQRRRGSCGGNNRGAARADCSRLARGAGRGRRGRAALVCAAPPPRCGARGGGKHTRFGATGCVPAGARRRCAALTLRAADKGSPRDFLRQATSSAR